MRRSKLECCESILTALVTNPLSPELIAYEANLDCNTLQRHLDFLMQNELVEERSGENDIIYGITDRGAAVLRALNFQRYLGKVKDTIRAIDEAMQAVPEISDRADNKPNET